VWTIVEREWSTGSTKGCRVTKRKEARLVWTSSSEAPRSRGLCGHVAEYKVGPRILGTHDLGEGKFDGSTGKVARL
jgi:hypothetical protein